MGQVSLATLVLLAALGPLGSSGHAVGVQRCVKPSGMKDFDPERFYGRWFINEVYATINSCITLDYASRSNGMKISQGRQITALDAVNFKHTTNYAGSATVTGSEPSEMTINWPIGGLFGEMSHIIIDTDYETYALTYECQGILWIGSRYSASILSRDRELSPEIVAQVKAKAKDVGIPDLGSFKKVDQQECTAPGEGVNIDTDIESFNLLGLVSDEKIATITTEAELIKELGLEEPKP